MLIFLYQCTLLSISKGAKFAAMALLLFTAGTAGQQPPVSTYLRPPEIPLPISLENSNGRATLQTANAFIMTELPPYYPGGEAALSVYLHKNVRYPEEAFKKRISGVVWTQFVIDSTGRVTNVGNHRAPNRLRTGRRSYPCSNGDTTVGTRYAAG